jgi:hypothetical protein
MPNDILAAAARLSDAALVQALKDLVGADRDVTAQLVAHVAEMDTRDVHLRAGYGSLFVYCRDALGLSEAEAYSRIEAARAARRFPVVLDMLAEGALNLTTLRLLAPHLTLENHRRVLDSARGKRKDEVEEIVAGLAPKPEISPSIRKMPVPRQDPPWAMSAAIPVPSAPTASPTEGAWPLRPATHVVATTPFAPDRYRLQFMIGGETLERFRLAKDMLRHAVPSGDPAAILDRALGALLGELVRKKFAATDHPRTSSGPGSRSRQIPAEVKRSVWVRDLGRCAYVSAQGRRCNERAFVEFHHVQPYAAGGEATAENVQLRCRSHNAYEARLFFGKLG